MAENNKDKFVSLATDVEDATLSREDISGPLDDLIYYSVSEKYELSDDVIEKATELLKLLIAHPSLELANPLLKCFNVAFEAWEKKEHPVPLPQIDPSIQHTLECCHVRHKVTKWSAHYRDTVEARQFTKHLKDPIAKFKRLVVRFPCQQSSDCLSKVESALKELVEPYPGHRLSLCEIQALALGFQACSYALDADVAHRAHSSSLQLQRICRKNTDSPGCVPNDGYEDIWTILRIRRTNTPPVRPNLVGNEDESKTLNVSASTKIH